MLDLPLVAMIGKVDDKPNLTIPLINSTIKLWSFSGNQLQELVGHTSFIYRISYIPQTGELASVGEDRTLRIWNGIFQ